MRAPLRALVPVVLLAALSAAACAPAEPDTPLALAAAAGDLPTIETLAAAGADLNGRKARGTFTPLIWAARAGQVHTVRRLVALGADINQTAGVNDWTPLRHALHTQRPATAAALIELGANISGEEGRGALAMAAGYGHARVVQALLARGVDPHAPFPQGPSLLALAAAGPYEIDYEWKGCAAHTATVKALLTQAPDLRLADTWWDRYAWRFVQEKRCDAMLAMLDAPTPGPSAQAGADAHARAQ